MSRFSRICVAILVATALIRLATLAAYPLADTTEARYAEIARLMLASGDWITPQIEAGVPFWGKPPLSMWLTASSFALFGLNEFAARLPSFLLLAACVLLVSHFGRKSLNRRAGLVAAVIVATSGIGFVNAGAVMTDPTLLLSTTLAMIAFWYAVVGRQLAWTYVFFAALGLGLLAKGPIAAVVTLTPITIWLVWRQKWSALNRSWACVLAPLLTLTIAAPWYVLAEQKTPGFLNYFIVGEHWLRFVASGWGGDLYGSAHAETKGTIWLFWAASVLPWSIVAARFLLNRVRTKTRATLSDWHRYLLLWALTPMVFFTFAGNILPSYVLPGLPAFALLLAQPIATCNSRSIHAGWLIPIVFMLLTPVVLLERVAERSQRDLVLDVASTGDAERLVYLFDRPYSASFYSNGFAEKATTVDQLEAVLDLPGRSYIVGKTGRIDRLPDRIRQRLDGVRTYSRYTLMVESMPNRPAG